ncbi:EamA family transporter [Roseimaritima multifibrata]|nr:EamA family transporter [Roseimaritima multifibrata]
MGSDFPIHLLLPLSASILFVFGLIAIKRTSQGGGGPWTVTLLANVWAAILFSPLWFLGGTMQPLSLFWQPAVIAVLFIMGQVLTFYAISKGDVSVAAPVLGIKVLLVAVLATLLTSDQLSGIVWAAAAIATIGIGMVQWSARRPRGSVVSKSAHGAGWTIGFAALSACSFALFDVLVQNWSPAWGSGRFLPLVFWMVAILSLGFLPFIKPVALKDPKLRPWLLLGTLLIALQAICIVFALSRFGDATRVNVVYALRGLWGVGLAWWIAVRWGGSEADHSPRVMVMRLAGASLLTAAVVMVVLGG